MKIAKLLILPILAASLHAGAQVDQLYGTWRLVSWTRDLLDTGEKEDVFGKSPNGYISFGRDGRMMAIMVREGRPKPADLTKVTDAQRAELFKGLLAYGGTYKVEGTRFVTSVDISSNENWTGTLQPRNYSIDGSKLVISLDPQVGFDGKRVTSVLTWQKVD